MNETLLAERLDHAMAVCPYCRSLNPTERDVHRSQVLAQIRRTQSRKPRPLPAHVWPDQRPFLPKREEPAP